MTRRQICLAAALGAPLRGQGSKFAKRKNNERFLGAWTLASYEQRTADDKVTYPMDANPAGRITYDGLGRMSAQIMRRDRPKFASGTRYQGTPEEIQAAFSGYIGYYGSYTINDKENIVIHHVECCSFPNWVGTDLRRHFEFDGDRLILRVGSLAAGESSELRLVWVKAR